MKDIPGYEGKYAITRDGRVWSHPRTDRLGRHLKGMWMKIGVSGTGYPSISLHGGSSRNSHYVHRLVADAFIDNPEGRSQVNHKNGVKTDNRIENLEWCTQSENNFHAYRSGLKPIIRGEDNWKAKLTESDIHSILDSKDKSHLYLAEKYGVTRQHISNIRNGKSWAHVRSS